MEIDARTALPATQAFVVHFQRRTRLEPGRMTGRVEHIASGRTGHFRSLSELGAFVASVLGALADDPE